MATVFVGGPRDGEKCNFTKDFIEVPIYDGPVEIGSRTIAENLSFKIHRYYLENLHVSGCLISFYRSQELSLFEAINEVFENYDAKKKTTPNNSKR